MIHFRFLSFGLIISRSAIRMGFYLLLAACCLYPTYTVSASDIPTKKKIANTPEALEAGKIIYFKKCSFCHGLSGEGNGPVAKYLYPRPRNFQTGMFKFRSTETGALPTDNDLFAIISNGINGTAMQGFDNEKYKNGLTEEERWQVIFYIQTMSLMWEDDIFFRESPAPEDKQEYRYNRMEKIGDPPPFSPEIVAFGKEIYEKAKCRECHGDTGRGDGTSGPDLKDDLKFPILSANLHNGGKYKGGTSVKEIFFRFTTGLNGTPMPSIKKTIPENERWALAYYVRSLIDETNEKLILESKNVNGSLPEDPNDPIWERINSIDIRLTGQVVVKPRWQNLSINRVKIRSLYNDNEIAFHLTWDDRTKDVEHAGTEEMHSVNKEKLGKGKLIKTYAPYKGGYSKIKKLRDAIALQFPAKIHSYKKPHFLNGSPTRSVNLWYWRSDYNENPEKGGAVIEINARGFKKPFKIQPESKQGTTGKGSYNGGQWKVVIKRPLLTDEKSDIQFIKGQFIPLAINAWDGSNGEAGMLKSISTWHYVRLETQTPVTVYVYSLLTILLSFLFGLFLIRAAKRTPIH